MADSASFVVSLIDKVTGPAKKAMRGVQRLTQSFKNAKTNAEKARKAEEAAWRAMGRTQGKDGRWREANGKFVGSGKGPKGKGWFNAISGLAGKAGGKLKEWEDDALSSVYDKGKMAALGFGLAGAAAGAMLVKNTVQMATFKENSMIAFTSLTGSADTANQAWETTLNLSRNLGMGVEDVAGSMKHLLAMQFKLGEAEELVKLSSDLTSVTGDAHSAERALVAMTQIKAKGKLQAEELTGQLAEAGVSTTLVYDELRKQLGGDKKNSDIIAMITAGKIDSDMALTAIKGAIMHKTHSETAGAAGSKMVSSTLSGLWTQLKNAPQFMFIKLADAVKSNLDKLRPLVQRVTAAIDGIQGDQMTRFVGNVLDFMSKLVPLAMEFAAGFGEGFSAINDAMGEVDPAKASMQTARDLGLALAKAFETAFKAIKMVADLVLWLDEHRGVAVAVASMLAVDKVAGTGTAAKGIWQGGKWAAGKLIGTAAAGAAGSAVTTAAAGTGTAAAAGGGATGLAALTAGLGAAGLAAGGAALVGVGAAGASWAYREELAEMLYGYGGSKGERGLQPTAVTTGLQQVASARPTTNHVKFESSINIDGSGNDPNQIARTVSDSQRGMMEQFFQGQALEQGATG